MRERIGKGRNMHKLIDKQEAEGENNCDNYYFKVCVPTERPVCMCASLVSRLAATDGLGWKRVREKKYGGAKRKTRTERQETKR